MSDNTTKINISDTESLNMEINISEIVTVDEYVIGKSISKKEEREGENDTLRWCSIAIDHVVRRKSGS